MNLKIWQWPQQRRDRKRGEIITIGTAIANQTALALRNHPVTIHHDIKHQPRPPAPRPSRMTVVYQLQDGREIREYVSLNGMPSHTVQWPAWLNGTYKGTEPPPSCIRYEFGYEDGRNW